MIRVIAIFMAIALGFPGASLAQEKKKKNAAGNEASTSTKARKGSSKGGDLPYWTDPNTANSRSKLEGID